MLRKLKDVQGIGLFLDASLKQEQQFKEVTLVYGENARGKSTLANLLGSAARGEPERISPRKTIDADVEPAATLEFSKNQTVSLKDGVWTGSAKNLLVFDADFIDENVYSGNSIDVTHRRNLLNFALGTEAVAAQNKQNDLSAEKKSLSSQIKTKEAELLKLSAGKSIDQFIALPANREIDKLIQDARSNVEQATSKRAIANQPRPKLHATVGLDLERLAESLTTTIDTIHDAAEDKVQQHIQSLEEPYAASWIAQGQTFIKGNHCPFCGQNIEHVDLIKLYRTIFDDEYRALKHRLDEQLSSININTSPSVSADFLNSVKAAKDAITMWSETGLQLSQPNPDLSERASSYLESFRVAATDLLSQKLADMNFVPEPSEISEVKDLLASYTKIVESENSIVRQATAAIDQYIEQLGQTDLTSLRDNLDLLTLSKVRHQTDVDEEVREYSRLKTRLAKVEESLADTREKLREQMNSTLTAYGAAINKHLSDHFAPFSISNPAATFPGGTPGAQYGIKVRGKDVPMNGSINGFRTALSESDKRTMAFAFFLASTLADPCLADKIVVVDDPMSSLDRNRRANTVRVLADIATRSRQLIVLAHDPKFLLDLDDAIRRVKKHRDGGKHKIERQSIKLVPVVISPELDAYTDFGECDLPRECESKYARNYRTVSEYVKNPTLNHETAAAAIRPLLEGYLHRRFPSILPANCMFGDAISCVTDAPPESPLVHAQGIVDELRRVAYFGNDAHHDTDADYSPPIPSPSETLGYARNCLDIVHGNPRQSGD